MPATNSNNRATNSYNRNKKTFDKKNSTSNDSDQNIQNKIIGEYLSDAVSNDAVKNALRNYLYGRGSNKEITPNELFKISQMMHMVTNCRQDNKDDGLRKDQIEMIANIFDEKTYVITRISRCYVEVTKDKNNKKIWTADNWRDGDFDLLSYFQGTNKSPLDETKSSKAILNLLLSTADYTSGFTKIYDNLNQVQSNLNQLNDIDPKKYQEKLIKAGNKENDYLSLQTEIDKLEKNNPLENTINNFSNDKNLFDFESTKTNTIDPNIDKNLARARMAMVRINIIPRIQKLLTKTSIYSTRIKKGAFDIFNDKFLYSNYDEKQLAQELREKISKKIAGVTKPVVEEKISKVDESQVYGLDLTTDKKHQINKRAVEYGYECANTDKNIQESEGKINENYKSIQQQDKEYDDEFNKLKEKYKQETRSDFNDKPSSQDEIIKYMQELAIKGKITELQEYSNIHKNLNKLKEQYKKEITQLSPDILKEQQNIQEHIISLTNLSKGYCEGKALEHQNDRLKKLKEEKDKKKEIINKEIDDILEKMKTRTIPDIDIFIEYADIQKDIKQLTQNIDKFKRADKEKFITNNETVKEYHNKLTKKYESLTKQSQELNNKMNTYNLDTTEISKLQNDIKNFNKATPSISKETTELSEQATKFNKENEKLKEELDAKIKNIKKRIDEWNSKNKKFNDLSSKLQEFTKNNTLIQEINKKYNEATNINKSIQKLNVNQIKEGDLQKIKEILNIYKNIDAQKFKYVENSEIYDYNTNMRKYEEANDNLSELKKTISFNNFTLAEIQYDITKRNKCYDEIKKTKEKANKYDDANTKLEDELKPQWDEIDKLIKDIKGDKSGEIQNIITKLKKQKEKEKKEADEKNGKIKVPEKYNVELDKINKLEKIKGILEKLEKTNFIDVANDSKGGEKDKTTLVQYNTNITNISKIQEEQNKLKKELTKQENKEKINKLNKELEEIKKDIEKNYNTAKIYNEKNNKTLETIKKEIDDLKKEYTDYPILISDFNNTINRIEYRKKQADVNNDKIKTQDIQLADTKDFDIIKKLDEILKRINNEAQFKSVNSDKPNTKNKYDNTIKDYKNNKNNYDSIMEDINNITKEKQNNISNQVEQYNKEEEKNVKNINEYVGIAQTYIKYNEDIYKKAIGELDNLSKNETYKNFKNIIEDTLKNIEERKDIANTENNQLTKVEKKVIDTKDIEEFEELNKKLTEINDKAKFISVNSDAEENEENTKSKYDKSKQDHDDNNKNYNNIINNINNITTGNQDEIDNQAKEYNEKEKKIFNNINEYVDTAQTYIKDNENIYNKAIEELKNLLVKENRKMFKNIIEDTQKNIEERKDIANTENNKLTKVEEKIIDTKDIKEFKELNKKLMEIEKKAQFDSVENDGKGEKEPNTKSKYENICEQHKQLKEKYENEFKNINIGSEEEKNHLNNENNKYIEQENEIIKNVEKNVAIATKYIKDNEIENNKIDKEIEELLNNYKNKSNFIQLIQNTKNTINKNFDTAQQANETIKSITEHVTGELKALKEFDELNKELQKIQEQAQFESVKYDKKEGQDNSTQDHFLSNKEMYEKNQKKHKELKEEKGKLSNMLEEDRNNLSNNIDEYNKIHKNVIENINNCKKIAGTYIKNNDEKYTQIKEKIELLKERYKINTTIIDKTLKEIELSKEKAQTENKEITGDFSELVIDKKEFEEIKEKEQKYQTSIFIKACNVNETIDNNIKTTIKNDIKLGTTMLNSYSIMKKFMNSKGKSIDKQSINKIIGGIFKEKAQEYNNNKNANEKIPTNIMDDKLSYVALLATKDPYNNIKYNIAFSGFPPEKVELFIIRNDLGNRKFKVTYDYNNNKYTRTIDPNLTRDENESNKKLFNAFADSLPTPEEYGKMREEALTNYNKNKEKLEKENPLKVIKTYPDNYINKQTPTTATAKQQSVMSTAINKMPSM